MVDRKLNILEHKLSVARKEGNRRGEGLAFFSLGNYYLQVADSKQAIKNFIEALTIFKEIAARDWEARAYGYLGNAYESLGDLKQAIVYHKQDLSIGKEVGDRVAKARACCNLGITYQNLGDFKQAVEYHKQELSIVKEVGSRGGEGDAYCNLGVALNNLGCFKQAIEYHKQHLSIAKELGENVGEGAAYTNLGKAYYTMGDFKQAIEYHKKSLSVAKEVGDRVREGDAYCNLGVASEKLANFKQAVEYHERYLSIAKEVGNRVTEGRAYCNLGNTYRRLGDFKQAIECHKQNLSIAKEVGDRVAEAIAYCNLGNAYQSLGNANQAIEYHKQSLSIAKAVGKRTCEGIAYYNLGVAYQILGNINQAIEYNKKYLSIAKEVVNGPWEGHSYCHLGNAYHSLGDFKQAIEYHKQDLSIAKEVGDRGGEGRAFCNLGNAYQSLGDFKQAIEYHEQYLSIAKEVGDRAGEGKAYCNLGNAYQSLGDFKQAIEYHNQYLSIVKEVGDKAGEGDAYGKLGDDYYHSGDLENALGFNERHLSISKKTGDPIGQGIAFYRLGRVHELSGSFSKALNYYRLNVKHYDETRRRLQSEDVWKISFRGINRSAYTALWTALLDNGEVDDALYVAEQGRVQALGDILKMQYGFDKDLSSAVTMKESISAVIKDLPSQTVFTALKGNTISFWLLSKSSKINFRQKEIETGSADSLIETTLKLIRAGTVVRCENRSLDKQRSDLSRGREAVEENSQSLSFSVNSFQPLYDVLVSPIEDLLEGDDLVFVPDGPFCLAPYSALSDSVRIRTIPSLTALKVITSAPDEFHSRSEALLVGDPCLKEVIWDTGKPMFEQLPCAKKEVEMIGKLLQTTPLTGRNATKAEVLKRMKSVDLIHIAARGDDNFGNIALAPNHERTSQEPEEEDYMLTMNDVYAVRLQARLVVLSCCHSGRGEVKSESVMGIARVFLCAGARSVLVSLWPIDDEATLMFMKSFYQHLADRKSASLALHHAMKSLREKKKYSALKYWAPFVLIGDDVTFEFGQREHAVHHCTCL